MGFDKVKIRQICFLVLYVAAVVLLLIYSNVLFQGLAIGLKILMPFLAGGAIAFILNIPMNSIENKIFKKWQGKSAKALKRPISLVLSIIFVLAIVTLVICAVVPQLRTTIVTLGNKIPPFVDNMLAWLMALTTDYPEITEALVQLEKDFDWSSITATVGGFLSNGVGNVLTSTIAVAGNIVAGIANGFISFVFAIYILIQKEKLQDQCCRILNAYTKGNVNARVRDVCSRLYVNFTNFICGQCLEAVILGLLFVIFMSIFQMDYAVMIGTLIAFTALIPIVGAFIGCGVGAFMLFIENPIQALWFLILFLILQQLEGNLIYPRVVGNSVGLPSIWVLASVTVGGSMFGVVGMLVFIPLMSTIYSLIRDDVNLRNGLKDVRRRGTSNGNRKQREQSGEKKNPKNVGKNQQIKGGNAKNKDADTAKPAEDSTPEQIVARLVAEQEVKVRTELAQEEKRQGRLPKQRYQKQGPKAERNTQEGSKAEEIKQEVSNPEVTGEDKPKSEKKRNYYYRNKKRSR